MKRVCKTSSTKESNAKRAFDAKGFTAFLATSVVCLTPALSLHPSPRTIFNRSESSIVAVNSMQLREDPFQPGKLVEYTNGTGTGFVFSKKKYIITNAHVVQNAVSVKVNDVDTEVIGVDFKHDIAVLKPEGDTKPMTPLIKCKSEAHIGDPVIAIGNPFGFNKSMTTGIVSGKERTLDSDKQIPLFGMIQTDAAINPGNSGGPLLDGSRGCVIGVNTALVSPTGVNSGIGFAIPIEKVERILDEIIDSKDKEHHPFSLGIAFLPDQYSDGLGIEGAIVAAVLPDSIGDQLGLVGTSRDQYGRPVLGDILVAIDDEKIGKISDVYRNIERIRQGPNMAIKLTVLRSEGLVDFEVEI